MSDLPGGVIELSRKSDGGVVIGKADQCVAMSLKLLDDLEVEDTIERTSTRITISGFNTAGARRTVTYRQLRFEPTLHPDVNEGGFVVLERVS
ncbi:MAG TPA: hypothetical protein VI172_12565 [Candidatus Dormibacteraeota bacterium]|jgi:hypothetical protein